MEKPNDGIETLKIEDGYCSVREGDKAFLSFLRKMPEDTACTTKDFMSSKELADVLGLGKAILGVTYHPKEDRWVFRSKVSSAPMKRQK